VAKRKKAVCAKVDRMLKIVALQWAYLQELAVLVRRG
jgi:hypothetical protein